MAGREAEQHTDGKGVAGVRRLGDRDAHANRKSGPREQGGSGWLEEEAGLWVPSAYYVSHESLRKARAKRRGGGGGGTAAG